MRFAIVRRDESSRAMHPAHVRRGESCGARRALGVDPNPSGCRCGHTSCFRDQYVGAIVGCKRCRWAAVGGRDTITALALERSRAPLEIARVLTLRGGRPARCDQGLTQVGRRGPHTARRILAAISRRPRDGAADARRQEARKPPALARRRRRVSPARDDYRRGRRPASIVDVAAQLDAAREAKRIDPAGFQSLAHVHDVLVGGAGRVAASCTLADCTGSWSVALVHALHDLWLRPKRGGYEGGKDQAEVDAIAKEVARFWAARATTGGYPNIARQFAAIVAAYDGTTTAGSLAAAFRRRSPWEAALASLEVLSTSIANDDAPADQNVARWWGARVWSAARSLLARISTGRAEEGRASSCSD